MPIEITRKFKRIRQFSPKKCDPRSFRTITLGKRTKGIVCCPKGKLKKGRCVVGTRLQSKLVKR